MLISLGTCGAALAQDQPQADQTQMLEQLGEDPDQASNPPGRAAQLSDAEGSVSLEPAGTTSWTGATLNRPLTLGDKLWTDQNSRAELDIGDAVIRLGSTTGFSFLNLDEQTAQMQVTAGTVIVHVRSLASGEQDEIDTPNLALTLEQPGTYRVEVSDSGDTTIVKVEDGAALATGGGQSYPVAAQQSVTFTGTSTLAADYASLGSPDALDDWSMQRDQQEQQALAAQENVPPDTVGADDLASYGTWDDTEWGYAWFPTVAVGWAPYSLGYWVWVSPWGWTWVDQEPWGFAPFHYGRWGYWHHRWCWVPGPRGRRPVYAPALVAWEGGAHGRVPPAMGGRVGWFPLGPRDVYVPGYHASAAYVRNINLANARLLGTAEVGSVYEGHATNLRYVNSGVPGAVTAVPRNVFASAQSVGPHRVILPRQGNVIVRPTTAAPAIAPVRQSVLGPSAGRVFVRAPPRVLVDRPVVARLAPPRAPVPFAREQAAIRANGGRPLAMAELSRMRPNTPAAAVRLASPAENRRAVMDPNMAARERTLQQPTLSPGRSVRNDRPPWAQGRAQRQAAPGRQAPVERLAPSPRQSGEFRAPQQHFAAPPRAAPEQHFTSPPRAAPEQHFMSPPRAAPEQHFMSPPRAAPEQHFTPPAREAPERYFTPPARQIPQQHFTSPGFSRPPEHFSAPREAPARAPERAPEGRRPPFAPRASADRRATVTPVSFGTGGAQPWQSPPPMYRPEQGTERYGAPARQADPAGTPYRPPLSPPPMYRPIPLGGAAARPPARGPGRLAIERFRTTG